MLKKVTAVIAIVMVFALFSACTGVQPDESTKVTNENTDTEAPDESASDEVKQETNVSDESDETSSEAEDIKIGLILPTEGLGDKNFCDMGYEGLLNAQEDFGIEFSYAEPKSISDYETSFRMYAESGEYDLIIGLGYGQSEAMATVAAEYPDQKFSIADAFVEADNVSCYTTKWPEQTFLCGVLAGLGTIDNRFEKSNEENIIGVILGVDYPSLLEGVVGFEAGARYVNPDCEVLSASVGDFNDPAKGKEVALSMYSRGADFIQHIAGASGLGLFNAAKEVDKYAIGVGKSQSYIEPDYIIATSAGNIHVIVYDEIKALLDGNWQAGVHNWGIKENAVGFTNEDSNIVIPEDVLGIIEEIRAMIADGELVPPSLDEELDAWVEANQYS